MKYEPLSEQEEIIGKAVVQTAFEIHKELGPGLLEKVYEVCFCHLLKKKGFNVQRQVNIPISFDGMKFDEGLRIDVIIDDLVICELKSLENVNPVWEAQLLSYLKLTSRRLGFLINLSTSKNGIKRKIESNNYYNNEISLKDMNLSSKLYTSRCHYQSSRIIV